MGERVFVTGATGFVGANLVRRLVEAGGFDVHIIARKESDHWRIADLLSSLTEHRCDITDPKRLGAVVRKVRPNHILHLATYGAYPTVQTDLDRMVAVNYLGTLNLVRACGNIKYDTFVNTGSTSEYGIKRRPMSEGDLPEPVNAYGATKAAATIMCQTIARAEKKPIVTLRLFSVYGYFEEPFRLVPDAITHCLDGRDLKLTEGTQSRDFVFVEDVVDAYLKAMDTTGLGGEILNVGCGRQYSVREVVKMIHEKTGSKSRLLWGSRGMKGCESEYWVADNRKIKRMLKWRPKNSIGSGLTKTIRWFRNHRRLYK